ncbi:MAG TPA: hypothetical protein VIK80_04180 [Flavihumibacter sp.]|jgi:hypothetical protein
MMQITVHFGMVALGLGSAFLMGYLIRTMQIKSLRNQILELEREKMQDHAEILQLQKQIAEYQQSRQFNQASTPVVPLKEKEIVSGDLSKNKRASQ